MSKFCSTCGKMHPDNAKFCDSCGASLADYAQQPNVQQPDMQQGYQQPYPQQGFQQPPIQQYYNQPYMPRPQQPPKRKSPAPVIIVIAVVVLIAAVTVPLFVVRGGKEKKAKVTPEEAEAIAQSFEAKEDITWDEAIGFQYMAFMGYTEIEDFELLKGKWKGYIRHKELEPKTGELCRVEITGSKDDVSLTFEIFSGKIMGNEYEPEDRSDAPVTLTGTFDKQRFTLEGKDGAGGRYTINMTGDKLNEQVLEMEGQQYIVTPMTCPPGDEAWLYLMRP